MAGTPDRVPVLTQRTPLRTVAVAISTVATVLVTLVVVLVGEHVYRGVAGMFIVDADRSRRPGDVQFRVITLDGDPPPADLRGWKDTVYVAPGTTAQLVMRFTDYTDPDSPYIFHCHLLRHEDRGMMGQFVVVKPGQRAGTPPRRDHADGADLDHASHGDG
jgi:FtsP/CotA-like multicopper oxidase with cupredoxin domain